ncbi:phenylalanine--tRNA ligase subunit beta [Aestuariicella hydrocarbonica]|uniref:Phenylalanine--tRNA ligase beta subunit n=1 Tax=Pseudomaricurvus hydrocarbonicus TaxID=1470433 RepID=A0A9E5JRZ8_9GAMM|nr:phenylalanine--tRNA ligase subunit beta [Aestuariicella hydrocarbonica]NHO64453.1 phenylalanine--tRNA ligase subunit beta [Aestuariicella hydrocarbonica]
MKLSENWLREWVNPNLTTADLVEQITMAGLEVDAVEAVAGEFTGVVVGEILEAEQHPDADKLRVCKVAGNGDEICQVVCGAPNARPGIKIPFAVVGAALPPGEDGKPFKIKKAKLRGVESFGMLCAQTELQLGEDSAGIWELAEDAPVGADLREYLNLNDQCIEVDLTPNRSDCLSVKGIARDVAVLNRLDLREPKITPVAPVIEDVLKVSLNAAEACSRYVGRVIRGVDVSQKSPLWMQEKLRRAGIRSIDAVVDVTNYVLLELGQPMHAFDLNTLSGGIQARMADSGEKLTLLDGQEITLKDGTLVIADDDKAVAMAGIMGGEATAVTSATQDIFLESAFFAPIAIAGRARNYGLHTDSSHRFERGVDYKLQTTAIERATQLLLDVVGGQPGPVIEVENEHAPKDREVTLRRERILSGLGFRMADEEVVDILTRLGLEMSVKAESGWRFKVPSYRFDIAIEEDLLEELARIYGYNRLPTKSISADLAIPMQNEASIGIDAVRSQLVARGYEEAIAYSFVEPKLLKLFDPEAQPVELQNPISADMAVMRTTLWPGLVNALKYNLNRQQDRVRLFETGQRFLPGASIAELKQEPMLAGLIYGPRFDESWTEKQESVDFYDIKGDLESVLALLADDASFSFAAAKHPALHPGQSAAVLRNGEAVGLVGALHPQLQKELGLSQSTFVFEITLASLAEARLPSFQPLSKFPEVRRDIAVIVDQDKAVRDLENTIKAGAGDYLTELKVFDVYVGKGIDPHRKSVALGLTFQHPSRTLNEDEINASMDVVVRSLEDTFNASLR